VTREVSNTLPGFLSVGVLTCVPATDNRHALVAGSKAALRAARLMKQQGLGLRAEPSPSEEEKGQRGMLTQPYG
jgi:hypothetical protein